MQLRFAFLGGRQTEPVGIPEGAGALLYVAGSYLNTGSEYQRHVWKRRPQHQGQLYSGGLFRYARHINYFGDLLLFTGWVLTRRWVLLVVPVLMLLGFVFVNIPALDRYLAERYGEDFGAYAARTKKLLPFLYGAGPPGRRTGRQAVKMPLRLWLLANGAAGTVLVINPTRELCSVFGLLLLTGGGYIVWRFEVARGETTRPRQPRVACRGRSFVRPVPRFKRRYRMPVS
jgi:hypothetical protein